MMHSPDAPFTPGPRQTVDTIHHPAHGRCRAVYRHGASALLLGDGSAVRVEVIGRGWSSEAGTHLDLVGAEPGSRVECPVLAAGDSHERAWSPLLGEGWFVTIGGSRGGVRFEGDDGRTTSFRWSKWEGVASPARRALPQRQRDRTRSTDEDKHWSRYVTAEGEALVFRMGGPPPPEPPAAPEAGSPTRVVPVEQRSLPGFEE